MLNRTRFAFLATTLLLVPGFAHAQSKPAFHDGMRRLWSDHVAYTRLFIVAAAANSPDKDATTQRLLQNQTDIGNAVAEFYGRDASNKLTALLKEADTLSDGIAAQFPAKFNNAGGKKK